MNLYIAPASALVVVLSLCFAPSVLAKQESSEIGSESYAKDIIVKLKGDDVQSQVQAMRELLREQDRQRFEIPDVFMKGGADASASISILSGIIEDGGDGLPQDVDESLPENLLVERKFLAVFVLARFDPEKSDSIIERWAESDNPHISDLAQRVQSDDSRPKALYSVMLVGLSSDDAIEVLTLLANSKSPGLRRAAIVNASDLARSDDSIHGEVFQIFDQIRKSEHDPAVRLSLVENVGNLGMSDPKVMSFMREFIKDGSVKDRAWELAVEAVGLSDRSQSPGSDGKTEKRVDLRALRKKDSE